MNPGRKIVLWLPDSSTKGGVEKVVADLATQLVERAANEVVILSCWNKFETPAFTTGPGVSYDSLGAAPYPRNPFKKIAWYIRLARLLTRWLLKQGPVVVLAEGSYLCGVLALTRSRNAVRIGCEHISYRQVNGLYRALRRVLYPRLDRLVVLTDRDRALFGRWFPRVVCIPNFIRKLPVKQADAHARTIVCVGRLTRQKGYDILLTAFAEVARQRPDWNLIIFGDGEERQNLERQRDVLGLKDRASFAGITDAPLERLAEGGIFAMPSRYEGFPIVLLEAMACGLPCVSFDCPGPDALLVNKVNGLLCAPGDTQALSRSILRLIDDPDLRVRFGKAAAATAAGYTADRVLVTWNDFLKDL